MFQKKTQLTLKVHLDFLWNWSPDFPKKICPFLNLSDLFSKHHIFSLVVFQLEMRG